MAQIIRITSEALQQTIRRLLPSQQGFGEDLQASNVIQPIIDLTPSAEGSELNVDLARAVNFGGATTFSVKNTNTTLANSSGFYRLVGVSTGYSSALADITASFIINDGATSKLVWNHTVVGGGTTANASVPFDLIVWLRPGDTLSADSGANEIIIAGSSRQVADNSGNIVNPSGFTPQ